METEIQNECRDASSPPSTARRRIAAAVLGCALAVALAQQWNTFLWNKIGQRRAVLLKGRASDERMLELSSGNTFLVFQGFDASDEEQSLLVAMLYFRATRAFWPTRVHVTLPDTQFLTTSEILRFQARNPVTGDMMRRCDASVLLRVLQAPGGYNIERIGVPR